MAEVFSMTFAGGVTLSYDDDRGRASAGLWITNKDGEGVGVDEEDSEFGELLKSYFEENF